MLRTFPLVVVSLAVMGCASKTVLVDYKHDEAGQNDWYTIPSDAPSSVALNSPVVPKPAVEVEDWQETSSSEPLAIEKLTDSIGNVTLRLNRSTGTSWELVSAALDANGIDVADRDRDQYRFELLKERYGLVALFSSVQESLSLVLVPDNEDTLLILEGKDDVTPDTDYASEVIETLYNYFHSHG